MQHTRRFATHPFESMKAVKRSQSGRSVPFSFLTTMTRLSCKIFLLSSLPALVLYKSHRAFGENQLERTLETVSTGLEAGNCDIFTLARAVDFSHDYRAVITVEKNYWGRLGNRIIALKKVLRAALVSGCHVRLEQGLLEEWDPDWDFFANQFVVNETRSAPCVQKNNKQWYNYDEFSVGKLETEHMKCAIDKAIATYFSTNESHSFGKKCVNDSYVAIHIRSGDTIKGYYNTTTGDYIPTRAHKLYGPYPTSFYARVLHKFLAVERVVVCCEDMDNPSCEFFKKLSLSVKNIEVRVGQPLIEDLHLLNCAKDVAVSYGTFREAMLLDTRINSARDRRGMGRVGGRGSGRVAVSRAARRASSGAAGTDPAFL